VAAPAALVEAEAGVLAGVAGSAGIPVRAQSETEVGFGVSGVSRLVALSSVPPIWHESPSGVPSDQNLPFAFKVKSRHALSVTRTTDPTRKSSPP